MVTTRASNFGRFAVAVLEPAAIPTKLDVIICNRFFQPVFEVEPFPPNMGLKILWNLNKDGNDDQGNRTSKDTKMKEARFDGDTIVLDVNVGSANDTSTKNRAKDSDAQMDYDWANDDLLGEETELSESAHNFVGVQKGEQVNVRNAATLVTKGSAGAFSAPARMVQCISQPPRASRSPVCTAGGSGVMGGAFGQVQQDAMPASTGVGEQQEDLVEQQPTILEKVQSIIAVGQDDRAEGAHTEVAQ
jgi:hypothetical protein